MLEQEKLNELMELLHDGSHDKTYHAILNGAAWFAPFLPAISAYISAETQEQKDKALAEVLQYHDERIASLDTAVIELDDSRRIIQSKLFDLEQKVPTFHEFKFNHRTGEIISAEALSGITDNGTNNYTLNFIDPSKKILVTAQSNGKIRYDVGQSAINLIIEDGCPDEISLTYSVTPHQD